MKFKRHIVDVTARQVFDGEVTVEDGVISKITPCDDVAADAPYYMPGFIDSHVHTESSMMVPAEFARVAVEQGTIGVVADSSRGNQGYVVAVLDFRYQVGSFL